VPSPSRVTLDSIVVEIEADVAGFVVAAAAAAVVARPEKSPEENRK